MMYKFQEALRSAVGAIRFDPEDNFSTSGRFSIKEFLEAGDALVNLSIGWEWKSPKENFETDYLPIEKHYLSKRNLKPIKFHEQPDNLKIFCTTESKELHTHEKYFESEGEFLMVKQPKEINTLWTILVESQATNEEESFSPDLFSLSITYDKFYQTCRVWVEDQKEGESEEFSTLKCLLDHIKKGGGPGTGISLATHPFTNKYAISLHPCQQLDYLQRFIEVQDENSRPRPVDGLLFCISLVLATLPITND